MSWLFGPSKPKLTPKEQVREWSSELKKEQRGLDRERAKIEREEGKMKLEIKKLAKSGTNSAALKTMAKGLLKSQGVRNRMLEASTRINSVLLTLKTHVATLSVAEHMGKSAAVMKGMQSLVSLPELRATAASMSKEMMKAGIISEMIDESFDSMEDSEAIDAEADEAVDKVIAEITEGQFAGVAAIRGKKPLGAELEENKEAAQAEVDEAEEEAMKARMSKLHS